MDDFYLHFDVTGKKGALTRPLKIEIIDRNSATPIKPLKYHADALVGLNLYWLCLPQVHPIESQHHFALKALDPHLPLHENSYQRLLDLMKRKNPIINQNPLLTHSLAEVFHDSIQQNGIHLEKLTSLIPILDNIEKKSKKPLLFNFDIDVPHDLKNIAHFLSNLLFNLRALIVTDYNHEITDPAFESLRVDSVADYLPKLDSITSDAILYSQFKRLEAQMPTLVSQRLKETFYNQTPMGVTLVESLERWKPLHTYGKDLPTHLNRAQLDWLFGSTAGILYRLREELLGLRDGYESTFYLDLPQDTVQTNTFWSFDCHISEELWTLQQKAS